MALQSKKDSAPVAPWFDTDTTEEGLSLRFGGAWLSRSLAPLEAQLQTHFDLEFPKKLPVKVTIEPGCIMDTAGACLIAKTIKKLQSQRRDIEVSTLAASPLLSYFLKFEPAVKTFIPRLNWKTRWLDYLGFHAVFLAKTAIKMLGFLGEILVTASNAISSLAEIRWVSLFRHVEDVGVKALPIVGLISFLIGMVLSYQSINQLARFGAEIYTIDFLGISILREIAVLLTAIVIAGRSGSAFTAQIGTMVLNQEVDAIRMLGLNPILVLVIPRLVALIISLPLLVFFAMVMGLFGGMVVTSIIIDVSPIQFLQNFERAVSVNSFLVGMSKAPIFGLLIGLVGCFRGFQVKGSAESVGLMTTKSVVESIFLVIVCDALMSVIFSYLKV